MASDEAMVRNPKMKESDITKKILKYLASQKHFAFKHWGGMMGRRGVSDIIGAQKGTGIAFFLEVKKPGLDANYEQKEFLFEAELTGAIIRVVHSVEEVKKIGL